MKGVRVDPERREARMLRRHVPFAGARVLDIGCGDGRMSNRIRGWVDSIVGVDMAGEDVRRAHDRKRLDDIARFAVADASRLPFPGPEFRPRPVLVVFVMSATRGHGACPSRILSRVEARRAGRRYSSVLPGQPG